tara:strand:- start:265 stop:2346 length:2082 start_codon:yes stop_codon:yes gene_type:complete
MPRKKRVTRKRTNQSEIDRVFNDVYDKIDKLQASTTASTISKEVDEDNQLTLLSASNGNQYLGINTPDGLMVDINSSFHPVSGSSFRPSVGTDSILKIPIDKESVKYDNNANVIIRNKSKQKILLKNDGEKLSIRNASDTADAVVKAKQVSFSNVGGTTDATKGSIHYDTDDNYLKLHTELVLITPMLTGDSGDTAGLVLMAYNADSMLGFFYGSTGKWSIGNDSGDSHKFKIATGSFLKDTSELELDTSGNLTVTGNVISSAGTLGTGDITGVTITTDSGGGSAASDTGGSADFSILGSNGVDVTNSGTTITAVAVPAEIDHDSLNNFVANEHIDWTASSAGTIHATNYSQPTNYVTNDADDTMTGALTVDKNTSGDGAENASAFHVDFDRTVASSGTNAHNDIGIDLDINSASLGTSTVKGMDIDVVGATTGTHTATGIELDVSGADDHIGIAITTPDNATGREDIKLISSANSADFCSIFTYTDGATTIETTDSDGTNADFKLAIDGDIIFDSVTGITHFRDSSDTDDAFKITVTGGTGATKLETVSAAADGHLSIVADGHVEFDGCGVGFDLVTPAYDATDTEVSFLTGNKQFVTFGAGNITNLKLTFPATSGNFILLLKQDGTGSRTVTNYKAFEYDDTTASGSASVKFAGGSNPTLTTDANHVDILSFFWDADNQIAYGVATLDFQF